MILSNFYLAVAFRVFIGTFILFACSAFGDDDRVFAGTRRRDPGSHFKTAGSHGYKFDWTGNEECRAEDFDGTCRKVENGTTCFGALVPYTQSSWKHLQTLNWHGATIDQLEQLGVYAGLPECWRSFRELLCAVFYPPCKDGYVQRIPRSLCMETRTKCSFLVQHNLWPSVFGDCTYSNDTSQGTLDSVFSSDCKIPRNLVWPGTSSCIQPFTLTDFKAGWLVDYCAMNCTGIRVDLAQPIQSLLMIGLSGIFIFTLLTVVLLFLEDNDDTTRVPYFWPLFWFSIFHLFLLACWLVQMVSGAHTTCRDDGSIRLREPSSAGVWCSLQYIILLGSSTGGSFWIAVFSYMHFSWRRRPDRCSYSPYQHVIVWAAAIVMITGGLATSQVDGDPVLSVCFVSKASVYGVVWYAGPLFFSSLVALVYFLLSVFCFMRRNVSQPLDALNRSLPTVAHVGILLAVLLMVYFLSVALILTDVFTFDNQRKLATDYILCKLHIEKGSTEPRECRFLDDGKVRMAQLHVFLMSLPALAVDVWLFVCADLRKRLLRYCPRLKAKRATDAVNGDVVMTEVPNESANTNITTTTDTTVQYPHRHRNSNRNSLNWSSSSSIADPGAVSEPECYGRKRAFINRLNRQRPAHHRKSALSASMNSLARHSTKTPSSLKSGTLPSEIISPASPFYGNSIPDINKYPMMRPTDSNAWWAPFGWPYEAWRWFYNYRDPSSITNGHGYPHGPYAPSAASAAFPAYSAFTASSCPPSAQQPQASEGTQVRGEDSANPSNGIARNRPGTQSVPPPPICGCGNAVTPIFWPPMPFSPYPQYWPPANVPGYPTPENQPVAEVPRYPAKETLPAQTPKAEDTTNVDTNCNGSNSTFRQEGEQKEQLKTEDIPQNGNVDNEVFTDDEEEYDSEKSDPEEEAFMDEQRRSLVRSPESRHS